MTKTATPSAGHSKSSKRPLLWRVQAAFPLRSVAVMAVGVVVAWWIGKSINSPSGFTSLEELKRVLPSNYTFLKKNLLADNAREILKRHPIEDDDYYKSNLVELNERSRMISQALESESFSPVFIKDVGDGRGYGLYAANGIPAMKLIGVYIGRVEPQPLAQGDYAYDFLPPRTMNKALKKHRLAIDSEFHGDGWMRFANDAVNYNTMSLFGPYEGLWHVMFVSKRAISAGEEITILYGDEYFQSRNMKRL
jgi:hypothetical protein